MLELEIGLGALGRFAWVFGGLEGDVRCTCLKVIRGINIHSYSGTSDLCSALIVITPPHPPSHSRPVSSSTSLLHHLGQRPLFEIKNVPEHCDIVLEIRRCFEDGHVFLDGIGEAE